MKDLEKRQKVYGICGECNEPGTGFKWCQPCNAKRFKENFKNWTSGNKDIDELIQHSQLNAAHRLKSLEWVPFEKFQEVTYITRGGFSKIYSAEWPEGHITSWDIENYKTKIRNLRDITRGLLSIHNSGNVHKDFHSGNILSNDDDYLYISDLGMCQPVNDEEKSVKKGGVYGVLPYMAPEVLRGYQYTKAADIYSFGIIMNEYLSVETPHKDIPHDHILAINICKGLRPKISEDIPKLLVSLIIRCWDSSVENRPT